MATRGRAKNVKVSKKKKVSSKKQVPRKRRRLKVGAVLIFLVILILFGSMIFGILSKPITNIYISGNSYLSDQQIIEFARLENYPSAIKSISMIIENRLENNELIKTAKVKKKGFTKVYIEVVENRPIFFNNNTNETTLLDGTIISEKLSSPTLVNYVPDTIYNSFVEAMKKIDASVIDRTSEIIYDPNDVDTERFLFVMDDNNYVYLTLNKLDSINNYINIVKKFGNKKGILYLDSGEYFKILDN